MMTTVRRSCRDAEALLFVTDVFEAEDAAVAVRQWLAPVRHDRPVVVALNKIDLVDDETEALDRAASAVPDAKRVVAVSGLERRNLDLLARSLADVVPAGPKIYEDDDVFTDRPMRFFAAEIVREQILEHYDREIPYACEVSIDKFDESNPDCFDIEANIFVDRPSQKGILIGRGGAKLKQVGTKAREQMQDFFQVPKIMLRLWVKVDPNWRKDAAKLRHFGYPVP
ncbi:hypothetical protein CTAYLR_009196 [Chrysophaeum taylorii]|uniref:KH type-2 domain-containing protein n=1 Tax=Chrysophaeum taylorii TaxID=2483200 RepID=A0AAD7XPE6_9STRA|nr:hypothetical protein CTAYLR_009196 [Chrysophaeum taylorii]